jgi:glycosyltransferase involved in cell wall biosynthesis
MNITVILCTYNRCQSLAKALGSVAVSILPPAIDWEVLVVDNNSNDQTSAVVQEFSCKYPGRFRYIFAPKQGKSYALNCGIRESYGEVLAFMDDDVEVDPNWLQNLTAALKNREWSGAGGRILPEAGFTPPRWMDTNGRYALSPLAMFDLGIEAGELMEAPVGTNMAFHKAMFLKYGGFRTDLGPQPGSEIRNEDAEFGSRLLAGSERFWYEPSAVVYHSIPPSRMQKAYFQTWWFDKARADVRQDGISKDARWYVAGIPIYLFRRLAVWTLKWIFSVKPRSRFSCKLSVWRVMGAIAECYRPYLETAQVANKSIVRDIRTPLAPREKPVDD